MAWACQALGSHLACAAGADPILCFDISAPVEETLDLIGFAFHNKLLVQL